MPFSEVWNPATPADSDQLASGDDAIRQHARALDERLASAFAGWPDTDPLLPKAGTLTTALLADANVTEPKLADDSVSRRTIVDAAIDTPHIEDAKVTQAKLEAAVRGRLWQREVGTFTWAGDGIGAGAIVSKDVALPVGVTVSPTTVAMYRAFALSGTLDMAKIVFHTSVEADGGGWKLVVHGFNPTAASITMPNRTENVDILVPQT